MAYVNSPRSLNAWRAFHGRFQERAHATRTRVDIEDLRGGLVIGDALPTHPHHADLYAREEIWHHVTVYMSIECLSATRVANTWLHTVVFRRTWSLLRALHRQRRQLSYLLWGRPVEPRDSYAAAAVSAAVAALSQWLHVLMCSSSSSIGGESDGYKHVFGCRPCSSRGYAQ